MKRVKQDSAHPHAAGPPPQRWRRRAWLARLIAWCGGLSLFVNLKRMNAADPAAAIEYKVKGGYLFNFARFIDWPASAMPSPESPFVIGMLDAGEALSVVQPLLAGRKLDGHPVEVRAVTPDQIGKGIHILFVTRSSAKTPEEIRMALGNAPTLVVGETELFAERGGTIGFTREEESIRFCLNLERAEEAGLKVSSKLSNVAKIVKSKKSK